MGFLSERPAVVAFLGVVLAGAVAGVATAVAGLPSPYAVVVGLAVGSPAMNLGGGGDSFDRRRYLEQRSSRGALLDTLAAATVGLVVGAGAVTLLLYLGVRSGLLLVAVAAGGTAIAGSATFVRRTMEYRNVDRS